MEREGIKIPKFEKFDPLAVATLGKAFVKYAAHVSTLETGRGSLDPLWKIEVQATDIPIDSNGTPFIPAPFLNSAGNETAANRQRIIRFFVNAHYSKQCLCLVP